MFDSDGAANVACMVEADFTVRAVRRSHMIARDCPGSTAAAPGWGVQRARIQLTDKSAMRAP
jgi:hypothetical protein